MDAPSSLGILATLRQQFVEASHRWPTLQHTLVAALEHTGMTLGPQHFATAPHAHAYMGVLIDPEQPGVNGSRVQAPCPSIHTYSVFDLPELDPGAAARFAQLAAPAWRALLQLDHAAWTLLTVPADQPPDTLVGRMWLRRYRVWVDRNRILTNHAELKARGFNVETMHLYVPPTSQYETRGIQKQDDLLWIIAVHNIGWQCLPGAALQVARQVWGRTGGFFTFHRDETELDFFDGKIGPKLRDCSAMPIAWFWSQLPVDPFLASAFAIDLLASIATVPTKPTATHETKPIPDDLISQADAADLLGCSDKTVGRRIEDKTLAGYGAKGARKVSRAEVQLKASAILERKPRRSRYRKGGR